MKVIAFYLPQFHVIPENEEMWGEGFTDWNNVRAAKNIYEWQKQPVVPINNNYYNLLDRETLLWQVGLAKKYGVYGFCMYHYWYNGKLLLEKPLEMLLGDKDIDIPFCICWANHDWGYSWSWSDKNVYEQKYDDKDEWKQHFDYLVPFMMDERYIKVDDKPLLVIYDPSKDARIITMLKYWDGLARQKGLKGIKFAYQSSTPDVQVGFDDSIFDYDIEYQPMYARTIFNKNKALIKVKSILKYINRKTIHVRNADLPDCVKKKKPTVYDYDEIYSSIINSGPISEKSIPGFFVNEDTTPRKRERGLVFKGMTVDKFKQYFKKQIIHARNDYSSDMIFGFAWNEWAEGAYMEPDEANGFGVLEAIRDTLIELNEWPDADI